MKSAALSLSICLILASCFLSKEYRSSTFQFMRDGESVTLPLLVPKGFTKQERVDTAGVIMQTFSYPNGAVFYTAYLKDTGFQLQAINEQMHQPKVHFLGGTVFKGINENELFYREIRQGNMRFGYRLVPSSVELAFDSATNFMSKQIR